MQIDPPVTVTMNGGPPLGAGDVQITSQHFDAVFGRVFAALEMGERGDEPDSALPVFGHPDHPTGPLEITENTGAMSSRLPDTEMTQHELPSSLAIAKGAESTIDVPQAGMGRAFGGVSGGAASVHDFRDTSSIGLLASAENPDSSLTQVQGIDTTETAAKNQHASDRIAPDVTRLQSASEQPSHEFDLKQILKLETSVQTGYDKPKTQISSEVFDVQKPAPILPVTRGPDVEPAIPIITRIGNALQSDPSNPQPTQHQENAPSDTPAGQGATTQLLASENPKSAWLPVKPLTTEPRQTGAGIKHLEIPDLSMATIEKSGTPAQASETGKRQQVRAVPPFEHVSAVAVSSALVTEAAGVGVTMSEELGVIVTTAPSGSSDIRMAPPLLTRADLPQTVARQLIEVIRSSPDTPVEVSLNPEELGRVRVALATHDTGVVSVSIAAERPETLALLKRHVDLLVQDFQSLGYSGAEFSFAEDNRSRGANVKSPDNASFAGQEDITSDLPLASPLLLQTTGLDLRL